MGVYSIMTSAAATKKKAMSTAMSVIFVRRHLQQQQQQQVPRRQRQLLLLSRRFLHMASQEQQGQQQVRRQCCTGTLPQKNVALYHRRQRTLATTTSTSATSEAAATEGASGTPTAIQKQRAAYRYYAKQRQNTLWNRLFGGMRRRPKAAGGSSSSWQPLSTREKNLRAAWYACAVVVGAVGATYAAVPLYKVFCQTTGFGGTTQRTLKAEGNADGMMMRASRGGGDDGDYFILDAVDGVINAMTNSYRAVASQLSFLPGAKGVGTGGTSAGGGTRVHTWTDEDAAEKLSKLRPVENADLITVRFDTTVNDVLPWSFVPVQLDVKVVPGETALSFFRVTNHSDKAITGVATYNVHPPKVGAYFQKVQCFCFEEQRLLPGETVDMPVFFYIDPEMLQDSQVSYVKSVTLSYTFFQTDQDDDDDDE